MRLTLRNGLEDLYRIAVAEGKTTSPSRPKRLGDLCVQELGARGLRGARTEESVEGIGRAKQWDVAWRHEGKVRLAISLKSVLANIPGTVPNRIDDLMGEVANLQLLSPEIVLGYIMVFDSGQDSWSSKHDSTWLELLRSRLDTLSGRAAPGWAIGAVEAHLVVEVDFSSGFRMHPNPAAFTAFLDRLVEQVRRRNPGLATGG